MQCSHKKVSPESYVPSDGIFDSSFIFYCDNCREAFDSNQFNLAEMRLKSKIKRQIKLLKTISKSTGLSYDEVIPKYNLFKLTTSKHENLIENIKANKFNLKYLSTIRPDNFVKISNKEDLILIEWGNKEDTYLSASLRLEEFLEFSSYTPDLNYNSVYSLLLDLKDLI